MKKVLKTVVQIIAGGLLSFFLILPASVRAEGLALQQGSLDLGDLTPGGVSYGIQFIDVSFSGATTPYSIEIKNSNSDLNSVKGLINEANPSFYIKCTDAEPNFRVVAKKINPDQTEVLLTPYDGSPLVSNRSIRLFNGQAGEIVHIYMVFNLEVPFRSDSQLLPLGRYSTTLKISAIY